MRWDNFCHCIAYMSATGSVGCLLYLLYRNKLQRCQLSLSWIKGIILFFLVPVVYPVLLISRMKYLGDGNWLHFGLTGTAWPESVRWIFAVISVIWVGGLMVGVAVRMKQYVDFRVILRANLTVKDSEWETVFSELTEKHGQKNIRLYRNPCVEAAFITGLFRPMIVIPEGYYARKEKYMVIEHELTHAANRDQWWKKIVLIVSWLHWYNPLVYWLIKQLTIEQEICCDGKVCEENDWYTCKEYCEFLYKMGTQTSKMIFMSSIVETKSELERRIEAMSNREKVKRVSKWLALVMVWGLCASATVPVYAVGDYLLDVEDEIRSQNEIWIEDDRSDQSQAEELVTYDDGSIPEISLNTINLLSSMITIDTLLPANTRATLSSRAMVAGDEVSFLIMCNDPSVTFSVEVKNVDTGEITYVLGTDALDHAFTIKRDGNYCAMIHNRGSVSAVFEGCVMYPD